MTDTLPVNVRYMDSLQVWYVGGPVISVANPEPPYGAPLTTANNQLVVTFTTPITGQAGGPDLTISFDFYVPKDDGYNNEVVDLWTCVPATSENNVKAEGGWVPTDRRDSAVTVVDDPPGPENVLTDRCLALQKYADDQLTSSGFSAVAVLPGSTVTYRLEFQISDYAAFQDIHLCDF